MSTAATWSRAVEIAEAIEALDDTWTPEDVAALFQPGEHEVFRLLDEKPGSSDFAHLRSHGTTYGDWHMRLRQTRNSSQALFDRLAGEDRLTAAYADQPADLPDEWGPMPDARRSAAALVEEEPW